MDRLRIRTVWVLLALVGFMLLHGAGLPASSLAAAVPLCALAATGGLLMLAPPAGVHSWAWSAAAAAAVAAVTTATTPGGQGLIGWLSILGQTVLLASAFLGACNVGRALMLAESVVARLPVPELSSIPEYQENHDLFQSYFDLSRRYERPFGVVVVEPQAAISQPLVEKFIAEIRQSLCRKIVAHEVGVLIGNQLRRSDMLFSEKRRGRFVILCPETDTATCSSLASRLEKEASGELGVAVKCGTASFPDVAVTYEELISAAHANIGRHTETRESIELKVTPARETPNPVLRSNYN